MRLGRRRVGDTGRRVLAFVSPIPITLVIGWVPLEAEEGGVSYVGCR